MQKNQHLPTITHNKNIINHLITTFILINHNPNTISECIFKQPFISPFNKALQSKGSPQSTDQYKKLLIKQFLSNDQTTYDDSDELIISFGKDFGSQISKDNYQGVQPENITLSKNKQKIFEQQFTKINIKANHNTPIKKQNQPTPIKTIDLMSYHQCQPSIQINSKISKNILPTNCKYLQNYNKKNLNKKHPNSPTSKQYLQIQSSQTESHYQRSSNQKKQKTPPNTSPTKPQCTKVIQSPHKVKKVTFQQSAYKSPTLNKSFAKGSKSPIKSPTRPISISISLPPIPAESEFQNKQKDFIKQITQDIKGLIKKIETQAEQEQNKKQIIKFQQKRQWKN